MGYARFKAHQVFPCNSNLSLSFASHFPNVPNKRIWEKIMSCKVFDHRRWIPLGWAEFHHHDQLSTTIGSSSHCDLGQGLSGGKKWRYKGSCQSVIEGVICARHVCTTSVLHYHNNNGGIHLKRISHYYLCYRRLSSLCERAISKGVHFYSANGFSVHAESMQTVIFNPKFRFIRHFLMNINQFSQNWSRSSRNVKSVSY